MADTQTLPTPTTTTTPALPRTVLRRELGRSGTIITQGFISQEEYNRNLIGRQGLQNYDVMSRSDATTHAALQVCKLPILAAHWKFKPASDDPADIERADLANREFFNRKIDFYDVLSEGLTCLDFGHSVLEIVYEPTTFDGQPRWGLAKLASRKQTSILRWQTSTGQPGITQILLVPTGGAPNVDIPMQKLCIFTNEKRGENYEGISLLRFAYKHWYLKDKLELMNAVALERMGLGIPYVKTGINNQTNGDEQAIADVESALRQIRVNEESYLKYPADLEVGMLDMKASSTKDILPTLQYEDTQILLSVMAQFLGLGQGDHGGSRALSQDHSKLFLRSLEAVSRVMARGFQSVANRLIDLNYSDLPNGYPTLACDDLDDDDVATISDALQKLVTAGVITPGLEVENRGRSLLDIKELTEEDWQAKQAEQQQQEQQQAEAEAKAAEQQAKNQPQDQPPADPKAKQKADALTAARIAQRNLLGALAEG